MLINFQENDRFMDELQKIIKSNLSYRTSIQYVRTFYDQPIRLDVQRGNLIKNIFSLCCAVDFIFILLGLILYLNSALFNSIIQYLHYDTYFKYTHTNTQREIDNDERGQTRARARFKEWAILGFSQAWKAIVIVKRVFCLERDRERVRE